MRVDGDRVRGTTRVGEDGGEWEGGRGVVSGLEESRIGRRSSEGRAEHDVCVGLNGERGGAEGGSEGGRNRSFPASRRELSDRSSSRRSGRT